MATNLTNYTIVDGPTLNVLFDALKYAYNKDQHIAVLPTFSIDSKMKVGSRDSQLVLIKKIIIKINGLSHEDASGHRLLFDAYIVGGDMSYDRLVSGFYDARQKTGYINIG